MSHTKARGKGGGCSREKGKGHVCGVLQGEGPVVQSGWRSHSFIHQVFIGCLLCARLWDRPWDGAVTDRQGFAIKELVLQLGERMHIHTENREAREATGALSREASQATRRSLFYSEVGTAGNHNLPYKKRFLSSCAGRGRQGRKLHLTPGKGSNDPS